LTDIRKRATFIKFERPLLPPPPIDSEPYWCYVDTLIFHDAQGKKVWEQEIPEAQLYWVPGNHEGDVFDKYFSGFQCFKDGDFGWQLRFELSHERAKKWLQEAIAVGVKKHHEAHFQEH
jgi:hypothetical protein